MKRQIVFVALFISIIALISVGSYNTNRPSEETHKPLVVVIRIDDIQDYAFKEAQLYLLEHSRLNNMPLSLAIIPTSFGEDHELVEAVKQAIISGSEVTAHGWEHENLSQCTFDEQKMRLLKAKQFLQETLNAEINVLVPPVFSYNTDTINAMEENDYTIISGLTEFHERCWVSENIQSIPGTIELCDFSNNAWHMKSERKIMLELNASIEQYGYAIIVTHPQEFMSDNKLDPEAVMIYEQILQDISEDFSFNTIEGLGKILN